MVARPDDAATAEALPLPRNVSTGRYYSTATVTPLRPPPVACGAPTRWALLGAIWAAQPPTHSLGLSGA
jgi:hypothetical protein